MSAIEARVIEEVPSHNLASDLDSAFKAYQGGGDGRAAAVRVYAGLDKWAAITAEESIEENPLIKFARTTDLFDAVSHPFQRRTMKMGMVDKFSMPFNEFECAPISHHFSGVRDFVKTSGRMAIGTQPRYESNRLRDLGFFYLHLSGLMTNGDNEPSQGFAKNGANFMDLISADYLYNRGLNALSRYMWGRDGKGGWWDTEYKLRGVDKDNGVKRDEVTAGMHQDWQRMEEVIVSSRAFARDAWEDFLEIGPVADLDEMQIARNVADSYKKQFEFDEKFGRLAEQDFSEQSPVAPFFEFTVDQR